MSSIYVSEPPTSGKVVLETTAGDIEIELWSKEAPKACRNFIQLCMEGYYNSTIFHRVVPGWIVQGGDPTGTGEGGESIYGAPFSDEFHSRLRFNRRGLLGMANAGPNDNGSQFFITLASTPELQKKNTMFGVVVGQSLFTALKLGEGETDKATERPVHPRTILSARVLDNPFSDIVPRPKHEQTLQLKDGKPESGSAKRKRIKAVKNKKLLSFADDDSDDDACLYSGSSSKSKDVSGNSTQHTKRRFNMKSSHDLLESDPMLSNQVLASPALLPAASANTKEEKKMAPVQVQGKLEEIASTAPGSDVRSAIEKVENEINRIDGRKGKRVQDPEADGSAPGISSKKASSTALSEMLTQYSANKKNSATLRKKDKGHEDKLLERLSSFQSKIRKTKASSGAVAAVSNEASADKKAKCKLHSISDCKSCQPSEPDEYGHLAAPATESGKNNWLSHKLEFRNSKEKPLASDYAPRVEDYVVIDPREQEQKFLGKSKRSRK